MISIDKITAFALNYLTHQLLIATTDYLHIYSTNPHILQKTFNYKEKYKVVYKMSIEITALESLIFSNSWIAVVNQSYFIFLNDQLESSRIITIGKLQIFTMNVCQRTWEIMCLCDDFQTIKFWKFKFTKDSLGKEGWGKLHNSLQRT